MIRWIVIGLIMVVMLAVAYILAAVLSPAFRSIARDIAIVILAVFQMVSTILTIALLIAILYAVNVIRKLSRDNVLPKVEVISVKVNEVLDKTSAITGDVRKSTGTVSTTTAFVAERIVSPIIRVSSLITGVRTAASTLARRGFESEQG